MQSLLSCCRQKNERGEKYLPQERQNLVNPGSCSSSPAIWRRRFAHSASMKCKISVPTTSSNATSPVAQMVSAKAEVRASFARRYEERGELTRSVPALYSTPRCTKSGCLARTYRSYRTYRTYSRDKSKRRLYFVITGSAGAARLSSPKSSPYRGRIPGARCSTRRWRPWGNRKDGVSGDQ